jgi:uncharacterized membrane-anchored protein
VPRAEGARVLRALGNVVMVAVAELRRRDASVWSVLAKDKGEPDNVTKSINFNTYALRRDAGVVSFFRRRPPNDAGGGPA